MSSIRNTLSHQRYPSTRFAKGKLPRKTIVIGAGLSKQFGLPLASELLPEMMDWHAARGNADRLAPIIEFLEYFYPSFSAGAQALPLAEDVLGMLDTAEAYNEIRGRSRGYPWRIGKTEAVRHRFNTLLGEYLWHFQEAVVTSEASDLATLRRFVAAQGNGVVYVTFNYDLLLETALSAEGIAYSYTIDRSGLAVSVLKPHGSINWFMKTGSGFSSPSANWLDYGDNVAISDALQPLDLGFRTWRQAVLVAPTPNKQIELEVLKRTWTAFSSSITMASEIEIIGYSLPAADRLARLVLHRAGPRHNPRRMITVVNPGDVKNTYRDQISPTCKFSQETFGGWVMSNTFDQSENAMDRREFARGEGP